ncbi:hypothetical protein [Actinomadura welshii]|uniref:hypothetical protein n=1 Tax=Actinomadura welshii TaxID=3103817 RepID=UPI0003AD6FB9|nr:hypothetical protein [Actinomadura madurae]
MGGWDSARDDVFGEQYLLTCPLVDAIRADEDVVLLIDEVDRPDVVHGAFDDRAHFVTPDLVGSTVVQ